MYQMHANAYTLMMKALANRTQLTMLILQIVRNERHGLSLSEMDITPQNVVAFIRSPKEKVREVSLGYAVRVD